MDTVPKHWVDPPAPKAQIELSLDQERAVDMCCDVSNFIASVTGPAGTGKTLVLGRVYQEMRQRRNIVLCAPTGRAAKRIQELTKIPAKTIHRLLQYPHPDDPDSEDSEAEPLPPEPRRNRMNPLDEDMVIVDESSMLGPTLYGNLMQALRPRSIIRFFGDNNQLPPVEEGTPPFLDLLKRRPKVELLYNYRSGDNIVSNANRILRGSIPLRNASFEVLYSYQPQKLLYELLTSDEAARSAFVTHNHQIIVPANKGKVGTRTINPSLQLKFNPKGEMLVLARHDKKNAPLLVRPDDKFLWIKNDYKLGLFNGEIGQIAALNSETGEVWLTLDDREIYVPPIVREFSQWHGHVISRDPRKSIDLGYAVTIHKAQGSEFDTVIICMASSNGRALVHRNSFYTAVTRARERVIVICDRGAMSMAMRKHQTL